MKLFSPAVLAKVLLSTLALGALACGDAAAPTPDVSTARHALTAPAWEKNRAYSTGDLVSSGGKIYRCVQAHTSQDGWDPEAVPALWGFEAVEDEGQPDDPEPPDAPPPTGITFDYLTLDAKCDLNAQSCCQVGSTHKLLTPAADTLYSQQSNQCIIALEGRDTIFLQSTGPSSLMLGAGDDVAMDGPGDDLIWGGLGDDTINGYGGTNQFFAGWGNDTIMAANGNNTVVPGPGIDGVALGTGNDTLHIFDLCEVGPGERLDGGTGQNVLYSPVPLAELTALGVQVVNFQQVIVKHEPCRSQCADPLACDRCPLDDEKREPGICGCGRSEADRDDDAVPDCIDACPTDEKKSEPGVCTCGVSDKDTDRDGVPNCVDDFPNDPDHQETGVCNDPALDTPAGTACYDGVCPGKFACDAGGHCGSASACTNDTSCTVLPFDGRLYWFCTGPRAWDGAEAFCRESAGRYLTDLGSRAEAAFVALNVAGSSWTGGNAHDENGKFRWATHTTESGARFWDGGADGRAYNQRFAPWTLGEPSAGDTCVSVGRDGRIVGGTCGESLAFVCEAPGAKDRFDQPVDTFDPKSPSDIYGFDPIDDVDMENCVDEASLFGEFTTGEALEQEFEKCIDECDGARSCEEQCGKATDFINFADPCNDACPNPNQRDTPACRAACTGPLAPPTGAACDDGPSVTFREIEDPGSCIDDDDCSVVPVPNDPQGLVDTYPHCAVVGTNGDRRECQMRDVYPPGVGAVENGDIGQIPSTFCDEVTLCGEGLVPEETIVRPDENGGDLEPEVIDPETFLGPADADPAPAPFEGLDPCNGSACNKGKKHPWCRLDVEDELKSREPTVPKKSGGAGKAIEFNFEPSFFLRFGGAEQKNGDQVVESKKPFGPFGIPNAKLKAGASVRASVKIDIPPLRPKTVEVIDAHANLNAGLNATQCGVHSDLGLKVFGLGFVPADYQQQEWPAADIQKECMEGIATVQTAANRVKKAYHDALELYRQYHEKIKDDDPTKPETILNNFSTDLCDELFPGKQVPGDFLANTGEDICNGERPEETINRFIDYYVRTIEGNLARPSLEKAIDKLDAVFKKNGWGGTRTDLYEYGPEVDEHLIFNQQFFIGPVPVNLEAFVTTHYGVLVTANISYNPAQVLREVVSNTKAQAASELVFVSADAIPSAGVGLGMFAGVGFSVNGFTTKLGVQGDLSLGEVSATGYVGAGLGLATVHDERELPQGVKDLLPGITNKDTKIATKVLAPQLSFRAGLKLQLRNILSGSLSGKLKIKIAFFSKSWSKRLLKFNGICAGEFATPIEDPSFCDIPLFHVDGSVSAAQSDLLKWGMVRIPTPFVKIPRINTRSLLPTLQAPPGSGGSTSAIAAAPGAKVDPTRVEELFYDSLCKCSQVPSPEVVPEKVEDGCFRDADCCDDAAYCFNDPTDDKAWGYCTKTPRACAETCAKEQDCDTYLTDDKKEKHLACDDNHCKYYTGEGSDPDLPSTWCVPVVK